MDSKAGSENVKGPVINALGVIIAAVIAATGTIVVAERTGHLTTPSEMREFQKDKIENTRLQQQIAALREELVAKTRLVAGSAESSRSGETVETVGDYESHLAGCNKRQDTVTCVVRIANTKREHPIRVYNSTTSIIDSEGNEIKASVVSAGASTSKSPFQPAETLLPTNVPVKVSLGFSGIESQINHLSMLGIAVEGIMENGFIEKTQIEFRNILLN
jgi:hypothetical protein